MSFLPLARIEQTVRTAPENLMFCSLDSLITVASDLTGRYSEDCRRECVAELTARWYLNPLSEIENCLDAVFPGKEWHSLQLIKDREIFAVQATSNLPQKLWNSSDPFVMRCEIPVRKRLADLLTADGFIPVIHSDSAENAFFLPFFLVENDCIPLIGDAAHVPIENWLKSYQVLFGDKPKYRCIVRCRQNPCLHLVGSSLMLPLYLASQRKTGNLPEYNRLRLLSTGAIENGHLKAVATDEKQKALNLCFEDAYLFFPENSGIHSEEQNSVPLSVISSLDETLEEIRRQIEAKGLIVPTFPEAQRRLNLLEDETRHDNQSHWEIMLARLQTIMTPIQKMPDRAPESYLLCLMLQSAMHCHMGDTENALMFNKEAREIAGKYGLEKQLRRLEIEELVELQDVEDFSSVISLAETLKKEMERLNDDDLLMRYCGTMGQAHCYGFLSGIPGFEREAAKDFFQEALHHAQKLKSERDIAQDLNYIYRWYVLFDPASEAAERAYESANDQIERNLQSCPQSQKKNRYFLQCFKMQALYRRLLRGETIPAVDWSLEELPEEALFWLRALVQKYLGAIAAAAGKTELAFQYFSNAAALLEGKDDNIIARIRMTILAEACRSLQSESFRTAALDALASLAGKYPNALSPWQDYLLNQKTYPGLNYWY